MTTEEHHAQPSVLDVNQQTPRRRSPFGAGCVEEWVGLNTSTPSRYFETPRTIVPAAHGDVAVFTSGIQRVDDTGERGICCNQLHADDPITSAQARQLARLLISAADALDRRTEGEQQ